MVWDFRTLDCPIQAEVGAAARLMQSCWAKLWGSIRLAVASLGLHWFPGNRLWARLPPESLVDNLTKLSQDKWVTGRRQQEGRETMTWLLCRWCFDGGCAAVMARASRSPQVDGKIVFGCICKHSTAVRVSLSLLVNLIALLRGRFAKTEHCTCEAPPASLEKPEAKGASSPF